MSQPNPQPTAGGRRPPSPTLRSCSAARMSFTSTPCSPPRLGPTAMGAALCTTCAHVINNQRCAQSALHRGERMKYLGNTCTSTNTPNHSTKSGINKHKHVYVYICRRRRTGTTCNQVSVVNTATRGPKNKAQEHTAHNQATVTAASQQCRRPSAPPLRHRCCPPPRPQTP